MAEITAEAVKVLRERTGAGFMDFKRALVETEGDVEKSIALLRERGLAAAAKKVGRQAREGLVSSYIHPGGRIGVLIEVNCETDFVARTDEFQRLVRDLAIQVAGMSPLRGRRPDPTRGLEIARHSRGRRRGRSRRRQGDCRASWGVVPQVCLYEQPFKTRNDQSATWHRAHARSARTSGSGASPPRSGRSQTTPVSDRARGDGP
jgi:elongation factor Ts